jgi:hypothetical protein
LSYDAYEAIRVGLANSQGQTFYRLHRNEKGNFSLTIRTQQSVEAHLLDRLRGCSVELPGDVKPLGVGVDAELD